MCIYSDIHALSRVCPKTARLVTPTGLNLGLDRSPSFASSARQIAATMGYM